MTKKKLEKMMNWPSFSKMDIKSVSNVLKSNKTNYSFGKIGKSFEKKYSKYCGTKYALTISNGTLALESALSALDIKKGDEVIVTPRSFVATASSILSIGAKPVFVDVEEENGNIDPQEIKKNITKKSKAIICVHLGGLPCKMNEIVSIAKQNKLDIVEDCSQAHGAKYNLKSVGSFGSIGTWSFCQDKNISTGGEGGMITTNSPILYKKIQSLRDHGKNFSKLIKLNQENRFKYIHDTYGSNLRLTEMQSAIGINHLNKLDLWQKLREKNAMALSSTFEQYSEYVRIPEVPSYSVHGWYRFYIFIKNKSLKCGWSRNRIIDSLNNNGVPCFEGSCPEIYLEKSFKKDIKDLSLPKAKKLGKTSIAFLVHPTLTKKQITHMISGINKTFKKVN